MLSLFYFGIILLTEWRLGGDLKLLISDSLTILPSFGSLATLCLVESTVRDFSFGK